MARKTKRTLGFDMNLINQLNSLGLNKYEASIWLALLSKGNATASELSDIADVPRSRSYDVLESLEKKGFVMVKIGKPIKYFAVSPNNVLERVKKSVKEQSYKKITNLDKLKESDIYGELITLYDSKTVSNDSVIMLKGRINAYNTIASHLDNAKDNVIIATTEQGLARKSVFFDNIMKSLKKKGILAQIITPKVSKKEFKEFLDNFNHKVSDKVSTRMIVIDDSHVFIGLNEDNDNLEAFDSVVYIKSEFLANSIKTMLNLI